MISISKEKHPHLFGLYEHIYVGGDKDYWTDLSLQIADYSKDKDVRYTNYFYHEELVRAKLARQKAGLRPLY